MFVRLSFAVMVAVCIALVGAAAPAWANVFVWRDAETGVRVTFPDTWRLASTRGLEKVRLLGPDPATQPRCGISVWRDARFTQYPVQYADEIQALHYSTDFWKRYGGAYDNLTIDQVQSGGLGRGTGSVAIARYTEPAGDASGPQARTGLLIAALYFDRAYVFDCSVASNGFGEWRDRFLGIARTIDMPKIIHERRHGHYRDFTADGDFVFPDIQNETTTRY